MLKSKVIQTIVERCRQSDRRSGDGAATAGARSPAAGGGVAGPAPKASRGRQAGASRDPRLGQSTSRRRRATRRRG
ncbi:MAG TPA: hypothetical protein VN898_15425 [Candidatus Binatia bacterium]|nr:hypothetical protein [Candidatus Binatia bacterium]